MKNDERISVPLLSVDKKLCRRDYACVADCPIGIITVDEKTMLPVPVEGAEERCINCGHCVAVCPHGALSLATMPAQDCAFLPPDWQTSAVQAELLLKGRRSVRNYKETMVPRETLEKLIDIARYAPSGINLQPVRWAVVYDPEKVRQIAGETINWMRGLVKENNPMAESLRLQRLINAWERGRDMICRGAPHIIAAYALKENRGATQDCIIAVTYLEIAAAAFGLGACWAGYVQFAAQTWEPLQKLLGIPRQCTCYGALMIGYPVRVYQRIPLRDKATIRWK